MQKRAMARDCVNQVRRQGFRLVGESVSDLDAFK